MYWVVVLLCTQIKQEYESFESMIKFVMKWQNPQMAFKIPNATSLARETTKHTFWECSCYLQIMKLCVSHYVWLVLFLHLITFCQSKSHKNSEQQTQLNRIWCSTFSFQFRYYSQVLRAVHQFIIYMHKITFPLDEEI